MKLFEFAHDDPLRVKLISVASQLRNHALSGKHMGDFGADQLVALFKKNKIAIDKNSLYDIVKKEPLKNIIADISDDKVTFVGEPGSEMNTEFDDEGPDENEQTLDQMSKRAMK